MSKNATYRSSCASTAAVMNTETVTTVGESTSSIFISYRYLLMSALACPFMSQFRFTFSNISDTTASSLYFCISLVELTEVRVSRTCIFVRSLVNSALPCYL